MFFSYLGQKLAKIKKPPQLLPGMADHESWTIILFAGFMALFCLGVLVAGLALWVF